MSKVAMRFRTAATTVLGRPSEIQCSFHPPSAPKRRLVHRDVITKTKLFDVLSRRWRHRDGAVAISVDVDEPGEPDGQGMLVPDEPRDTRWQQRRFGVLFRENAL